MARQCVQFMRRRLRSTYGPVGVSGRGLMISDMIDGAQVVTQTMRIHRCLLVFLWEFLSDLEVDQYRK